MAEESIGGPNLDQLLTAKEVASRLRVTIRTLYRRIEDSGFPLPIRLGPNCVRWNETEVQQWIDRRRELNIAA
ncbi:AlpA family phage regulatory protein [Komagataeibacter sp. FNDCR1]|nr:AlpA family phage regulatory protein [Komagataeibacter sp. FNDCR1]